MAHEHQLELVDLYALDALEGAELREFEKHQQDCFECQARLDEAWTVTASWVPDDEAPDHVWDRIAASLDGGATVTSLRPTSYRVWAIVSTIAAAVAIALGGVLLLQATQSGQETILAMASEAEGLPGTIVSEFVVDDAVVATIVLTADGTGFVLPTNDLVDLAETQTYQLWVINEEERVISGGVLGHAPLASTFTWTDGVAGFALTREVAGGVEVSEGDVVAVVTDI
ncbi:MAG: anti-sigma factor [Acidimicrobiia bacterium]